MDSLLLVNYFEKQAKVSGQLKELMAKATKLLLRKDELRSLEKTLLHETLIATMDVYALEGFSKQLELQYQQQCDTQECTRTIYKHSIQFCMQVQNMDWNSQLHCKLELLQLQCQNEMRELNEEYEMEQQRRRELEQRPIVQMAREVQKEVTGIQNQINNAKQLAAAHQNKLLDRLKQLRNERNAIIVFLVAGGKAIVNLEKELETVKSSHTDKVKVLTSQKQDLISKLQKHNAKLPDCTPGNTEEQQTLPKIDIAPTTTKLEPFPNMGNVSNATVCEERKRLSFLELFKEWETKRQLQIQPLTTITAKAVPDKTPIVPIMIESTSSEANHISSNHLNPPLTNGFSKTKPRSILRRPSVTDDEDSGSVVVPKKRVRFTEPEVDQSKNANLPDVSLNAVECENPAGEEEEENGKDDTFVVEENNNSQFNGNTDTIEIFSTAEMEEKEMVRAEEFNKQKVKKPVFAKANKLLKKAKLLAQNKLPKLNKNAAASKRLKIEIQECRIVKPAGTKLPTKLPIELSPEPQALISNNRKISSNALPATKSDSKVFKSPPKLQKRKMPKMSDCDTFFREFLNQQSDSQENSEEDYNVTKTTDTLLAFDEPAKGDVTSKSKRKKTEMDFDRFFRETLMGSNESDNDPAAVMQDPIKDDDDDLLRFDTKYDESGGFFGSSVDEFFAGHTNSEKDDGDFLSFDFDGEEKRKTDDFL